MGNFLSYFWLTNDIYIYISFHSLFRFNLNDFYSLFFCTSLLLSHTIIEFPHFHLSFRHHLASKFFMIFLVIDYYYPGFNTSLQHLAMSGLYIEFINLENNSLLSLKLLKLYHASILETVKPKSLL